MIGSDNRVSWVKTNENSSGAQACEQREKLLASFKTLRNGSQSVVVVWSDAKNQLIHGPVLLEAKPSSSSSSSPPIRYKSHHCARLGCNVMRCDAARRDSRRRRIATNSGYTMHAICASSGLSDLTITCDLQIQTPYSIKSEQGSLLKQYHLSLQWLAIESKRLLYVELDLTSLSN